MERRRRTTVQSIVVAAMLSLSACGSDDGVDTTAPEASTSSKTSTPTPSPEETGSASASAGSSPTTTVPEALDFSASTVSGDAFEGASVAGRPVLLWFWAPWCPTCRGQIPEVESLASTYGDDLTVLGIGSLDSADAIADFAEDVDDFTQLNDEEGELYRRFGIVEQSSFVLLDAEGEVAFSTGYGGSDSLADEVADVVG